MFKRLMNKYIWGTHIYDVELDLSHIFLVKCYNKTLKQQEPMTDDFAMCLKYIWNTYTNECGRFDEKTTQQVVDQNTRKTVRFRFTISSTNLDFRIGSKSVSGKLTGNSLGLYRVSGHPRINGREITQYLKSHICMRYCMSHFREKDPKVLYFNVEILD